MTCALTTIIDSIDALPVVDQHRLGALLDVTDQRSGGPRVPGANGNAVPDVVGEAVALGVESRLERLTVAEVRELAAENLGSADYLALITANLDEADAEEIGVQLVTGDPSAVDAYQLLFAAYLCIVDAAERSASTRFGLGAGGVPRLAGKLEDMEALLEALHDEATALKAGNEATS